MLACKVLFLVSLVTNFINKEEEMVCPACPTIAVAGGAISGYFGFDREDLRATSVVVTSCMVAATVIALRLLFGISVCDGNGDFSLRNIAQVGAISLVLGIIYAVGVNILLNKLVPPPQVSSTKKPCCCTGEEL